MTKSNSKPVVEINQADFIVDSANLSTKEMAAKYGLSPQMIVKALKAAGVVRKPKVQSAKFVFTNTNNATTNTESTTVETSTLVEETATSEVNHSDSPAW